MSEERDELEPEPEDASSEAQEGEEAPRAGQVPPDDPLALNREVLIELRRLNIALERFNQKRRYYALSLTGGMARGFGAALGASLIFAIVLALASRMVTVPVVGEYVKDVIEFVRHNSPAGIVMPDPDGWVSPPASPSPTESPTVSPAPESTP